MSQFEFLAELSKVKQNGSVWILPGIYDVEVENVKITEMGFKGRFFIAQVSVLSSNNPQRPVGCAMDYMPLLEGPGGGKSVRAGFGLSDMKAFIAVCCEAPFESIGEPEVLQAVSDANPLKGIRLHLSAIEKEKKNSQGAFTTCSWKFLSDPAPR